MTLTNPIKSQQKIDFTNGKIELSHGAGGKAMTQLVEQLFLSAFANSYLDQRNDQAIVNIASNKIVITTDAHVVTPLFFPGGDIGSLAVHGTINDIAMSGAMPVYLTASFILEEGFPLAFLKKITYSMAHAASQANVSIIAGDTKVVERGKADGVFISTTGVGVLTDELELSGNNAKPGDHLLLSGYMGDHGIAIMSFRNNLRFHTSIESDSAALHELVRSMVRAVPTIRCLRDPTRGGVAATLNEWAWQSNVGFNIEESRVPIKQEVLAACELLGLDPFYVANEGKLLAVCPAEDSATLLAIMQSHPLGRDAAIIGKVVDDPRHFVQLKTTFGGMRLLDWLAGDPLPRIC